jgi:hypothetical protein
MFNSKNRFKKNNTARAINLSVDHDGGSVPHRFYSNQITKLNIKKVDSFEYNNNYRDGYKLFISDTQDFIFNLKPENVFEIELLNKKDKKRIGRFFENQYFKIESNSVMAFYNGSQNGFEYIIDLRRIDKENSPTVHMMIELQLGVADPEEILDRITNSGIYGRRDIYEWVEKNGEILHERYHSIKNAISVLDKLDNDVLVDSVKEDNSYSSFGMVWKKGGTDSEGI